MEMLLCGKSLGQYKTFRVRKAENELDQKPQKRKKKGS